MTDSEVESVLVRHDNAILSLKDEFFRLSWFMRGGVTVNDLLHIYSREDRELLSKLFEEHLELMKKTHMPLI